MSTIIEAVQTTITEAVAHRLTVYVVVQTLKACTPPVYWLFNS
jgi:hypothetical protein